MTRKPTWNINGIPNAPFVCFDYARTGNESRLPEEDGWLLIDEDPQDAERGLIWRRLKPKTVALILAANKVGASEISMDNASEWILRLDHLWDIGIGFLSYDGPDGPYAFRLNADDVIDHLGLKVNLKNQSNPDFDAFIRRVRIDKAKEAIDAALQTEL